MEAKYIQPLKRTVVSIKESRDSSSKRQNQSLLVAGDHGIAQMLLNKWRGVRERESRLVDQSVCSVNFAE